MRSHSGERPHQCDICNKRFFAASALKVNSDVICEEYLFLDNLLLLLIIIKCPD